VDYQPSADYQPPAAGQPSTDRQLPTDFRPPTEYQPTAGAQAPEDWQAEPTGRGRRQGGSRYRKAGLAASVIGLLVAGAVAVALFLYSGPVTARDPGAGTRDRQVASMAASWAARQVSHAATVSCDKVMCAALAADGFPSANLRVLGPPASGPPRSDVIIVTADLRRQLGSRLGSDWAPAVIASFGAGAARIDVRVIAPHGASAYESALSADLQLRKAGGAGLLGSRQITASATARRQLLTGQVDSRLLLVITALASQQPIDIVEFGNVGLGASPAMPLRFADLTQTDAAAAMSSSAYERSMLAVLRVQHPPYLPARTQTVRLADGQTVLRIEFTAPSPLGLLSPLAP
jgi:hypothetical protein